MEQKRNVIKAIISHPPILVVPLLISDLALFYWNSYT